MSTQQQDSNKYNWNRLNLQDSDNNQDDDILQPDQSRNYSTNKTANEESECQDRIEDVSHVSQVSPTDRHQYNKYRNTNRDYNNNKYKKHDNNNGTWNRAQRGYGNNNTKARTRVYNNNNNRNNTRMNHGHGGRNGIRGRGRGRGISFRNNINRNNQPRQHYNNNNRSYNTNNNNNNNNNNASSLRLNNKYPNHQNNNNNNNNNDHRRMKGRTFVHKGQMQPQPQQQQKQISAEQCAYATMVINNPEYLSGAFTLAWSLMTCGSTADRVIIIDEDINSKYGELIDLTRLFTEKFVIPKKLHFTAIQKRWRKYAESGIYDWINTAFNKYYVFMLTQYSRVIMLDSDQICLQNPDELFKLSCPAGICSFYSELNNTLQDKKHGTKVANADIRRSYERQWGMRGCLFMIEPSTNTFNDIIQQLEYLQKNNNGIGDKKCFLGADEKFLTKYYMTTNGDLQDSNWTHIHTKFSRLSYIDKTTLPSDPYFLHFCTFKPWKSPGNDKWIHEQWEDIAIWIFASISATLYINQHLPVQYQSEYSQKVKNIMSPDAQFYTSVLNQEWSKKYLDFGSSAAAKNIASQDILLNLYHIMKNSYKEQELEKQNKTKDLKKKIQQTMSMNINNNDSNNKNENKIETKESEMKNNNNNNQKNNFWSFDYSKHLLLSALLSQNECKIPDKVIWQFWDKSEHEIPEHIKFCIRSVRVNNPDWKHILITPANIWTYLKKEELPNNLLSFDKACHISDVVRVAILAKYGGIYCDATVICFKDCRYMNFNFFWDDLLMEQGYDFVGFKYDHQKTKWKNDEKFCCWFMATKKDNGLFYSWLNKINILMKGNKTSNSQLDIIDLLYSNQNNKTAFKKYVALGPLILDELFNEYCHYHSNFKYQLYDPRDSHTLLDHFFNYEQLWYLNKNEEYNFKEWFCDKSPHFIKLFCADKGTKELHQIIKQKNGYQNDKQIKLKDILDGQIILSDIFQFV